ncbi:hypothetical protein B0H10DRAFT_774107 [Mycena sp. CBHHK59/15]|nr:hypothetical protein B0H10DRAFT_774107 [Mycena sp. CBHHK59/15]
MRCRFTRRWNFLCARTLILCSPWLILTDEADQQRALIEMHGLYRLYRSDADMSSSATAKFKPPQPDLGPGALPASASAPSYLSASSTTPLSASVSVSAPPGEQQQPQQAPSVSAPIAVTATYYPAAGVSAERNNVLPGVAGVVGVGREPLARGGGQL